MIKSIKKLFLTVIAAAMILIAAPVMAENNLSNSVKTPQSVEIPSKQPIGKKQLAMKFIMAMLGVGASSVIIYVMLSFYNKFVYGSVTRMEPSEEDNDLKTPANMKDALRIFLKKTK